MLLGFGIALMAVSISFIGLLAIVGAPHAVRNRWFFAMTQVMAIWIVANFLNSNLEPSRIAALSLMVDVCVAPFVLWTFGSFLGSLGRSLRGGAPAWTHRVGRWVVVGGGIVNVIILFLALLGVFVSVSWGSGQFEATYTQSYLVYGAVIVGYAVYSLAVLLGYCFSASSEMRAIARLLILGFLLAVIPNIFANLVAPVLPISGVLQGAINLLGYSGFVALVALIYFAIFRQGLLDIRLVAIRALGYTLSILVSALLFAAIGFGVMNVLFGVRLEIREQLALAFFSALIVLAFQPIKDFFDRISNRLFYRDFYDPQEVLGRLGSVLVRTVDLLTIQRTAHNILAQTLHVSVVDFLLADEAKGADRVLLRKLSGRGALVFMTEDLDPTTRALLRDRTVGAVVALRAAHKDLGFLLLGERKSGGSYSARDRKFVRLAANELAIALQNALQFEEIQQFNETLQAKVDTATAKLRQANERLKVLNETKDDFVSMASHQLRTPLTSIKGYLSMVLDGDMGKITTGQRAMIEQAFTSSQRMAYLISDLLNMSRLRTGRLMVTPGTVSLNKIIEQEIAQLRRMAEGNSVKLLVEDSGEELPPVVLDETKIRQVIMNLVDNAIYYTGRGGTVTVRLSQTPKSVELRVIDTGIGVPVADQHKLFTRFYRASNAKKVRPDGTGIGLYMVRKVVTALGGSVIFNSAEGKGSTFGFSFPKVAPKVLPTVTSSDN